MIAYFSLGYLLSQRKYIFDILERATLRDPSLSYSLFVSTPMELNLKLSRDDGDPLLQLIWYRELVGALIYLSATWPDISHVVYVLSQFVSSPT